MISRFIRFSGLSAAAALFCLASLTANAQQKKPTPTPTPPKPEVDEVVRISTELVQTDVMVFDKDGRFVSGLKPEEFELLVDGKPQPITFFESVVTGGKSEEAVLRAAGKKQSQPPPVDASDTTFDRGRVVLFFVNDVFLEPGSLARTHKMITNYIDQMLGPNDQAAITSASGQIGFLQQLTNNPAVLRAALDRLKMVPGVATDGERPYMSPYAAYLIVERNDRGLFNYFVDQTMKANNFDETQRAIAAMIVERRSRMLVQQSDAGVKNGLSSLANLMRATTKVPGRKLVFFISDGFVPNFTGSDFTSMMDRVTGTANKSSVVIYSFDARGLSTDSILDASNGGGFDSSGVYQSRLSGERTFMQEPLHALAADTGGRAILNSNDLTGGIARALDETSRYYLLAWRPENDAQRASNFSKIKVRIAGRSDLKVQLRRGYLGAPPEKIKPPAQTAAPTQVENTDVLGVAESSSDELHAALALGYKQAGGSNVQLAATVQVNAQSPGEGGGNILMNVLGAVFDSRGKAVGSFKQRLEVPRTRASAAPLYSYVNYHTDLPPGLYQVRVIAHERGTSHLTTAMDWVELPKLKEGVFAISSLYVAEVVPGLATEQMGVNSGRRFARTSRLRFTTYIYNAGTPPQLGAQIKIRRGNQPVLTPPEVTIATEKVTNAAIIPYAGEFPLSSLAPSHYVLELTVTDRVKKASASQLVYLTIY
jgi:VWFA-related protein